MSDEEEEGEKEKQEEEREDVSESEVIFQISGKAYSIPRHISDSIHQKIIPDLEKRISDKSKQTPLRTPVIFAIIRLLKVLPEANMNVLLPKLFGRICETLKDSDQTARDSARHTLIQVCECVHLQWASEEPQVCLSLSLLILIVLSGGPLSGSSLLEVRPRHSHSHSHPRKPTAHPRLHHSLSSRSSLLSQTRGKH